MAHIRSRIRSAAMAALIDGGVAGGRVHLSSHAAKIGVSGFPEVRVSTPQEAAEKRSMGPTYQRAVRVAVSIYLDASSAAPDALEDAIDALSVTVENLILSDLALRTVSPLLTYEGAQYEDDREADGVIGRLTMNFVAEPVTARGDPEQLEA